MIPLKDDTPRFTTPFVTYFLLALNIGVFFFELALNDDGRTAFFYQFGVVPSHVTGALGAGGLGAGFFPLFTSMFLHAGWLHLIANIEDYFGHFRFLLFYLGTGIAAGLVHTIFNLGSTVPSVGASGAIAGVMGAYFLLYPNARVLTLVPFFVVFFTWLPAWLVLGYWFVVQFLSGTAGVISTAARTGGGVAFWAHVGGFAAGALLVKLFPARRPRLRYGR
jgi:membrane associated rhomboid family serine protease